MEMSRRERRVVSLLTDLLGAEIVEWNPPTSFRPEGWEGDQPVVEQAAAPPPAVAKVPYKKTKSALKKSPVKTASSKKTRKPKRDNNQGEML